MRKVRFQSTKEEIELRDKEEEEEAGELERAEEGEEGDEERDDFFFAKCCSHF
jgi:hypothetical protein